MSGGTSTSNDAYSIDKKSSTSKTRFGKQLDRWRLNAVETDSLGKGDGDEPGRIVVRIRSQAREPSASFRRSIGVLTGVFAVAQGVTAALKGTSKTTRAVVSGPLSLIAAIAGIGIALLLLGRYARIGHRRYRTIACVSALLLGFIILTGSAVRLTGSGLGCPDWPTCAKGNVVPADGTHAFIEFGNRVVTGLCVFAAAVGVLTALVRVSYRRDLVRLGLLTSLVIFSNAILGGIVVLSGVKPQFVMGHFFLAIAALTAGVVIFHRSGEPGQSRDLFGRDRRPAVDTLTKRLAQGLTISALVTLFLGTIVTGSGPHGGDPKVARYNFSLLDVARIHSGAVWMMLVFAAALAVKVARSRGPAAGIVRKRCSGLIGVAIAQGAIGYIQYFNHLPAALVQIHVLGATLFWVGVLWVRAATWCPDLGRPQVSVSPVTASSSW